MADDLADARGRRDCCFSQHTNNPHTEPITCRLDPMICLPCKQVPLAHGKDQQIDAFVALDGALLSH
jgi:hypothetical protein